MRATPRRWMTFVALVLLLVATRVPSPTAAQYSQSAPELAFVRYLGGSSEDAATEVALDAGGNVYVLGTTWSPDFPPGVQLRSFVTKLDSSGEISYSTFVGIQGLDIAVDRTGAVFVGGRTAPFDSDASLVKLTASGEVAYSISLGGTSDDSIAAVALASDGTVIVAGWTQSLDFPVTADALQPVPAGGADAFVAKLDPEGRVQYATYVGGRNTDSSVDVVVDSVGSIYLLGITSSQDFPTTRRAFQPMYGGGPDDAFVAKLSADGSALVYASYFGGESYDTASSIAVDAFGHAHLAGHSWSRDLPTKNPLPSGVESGIHPFAAKVDTDGSSLMYSGYLGVGTRSPEDDFSHPVSVALDAEGNAIVTGWTVTNEFPTAHAFQTTNAGGPAYRSLDGGRTWLLANDGLVAGSVRSFAFAPRTPGLIYAVTDRGVFRTTDGGRSWREGRTRPLSPSAGYVIQLRVHPTSPEVVYAATSNGVFISADGGDSWTDISAGLPNSSIYSGPFVTALVIAPSNPSTLYVKESDGLYRSDTGGSTWTQVRERSTVVAVDPRNAARVYSSYGEIVSRSEDRGRTWTELRGPGFLWDLQVDPATPSTLYASGRAVWKSTDQGSSWQSIDPELAFPIRSVDASASPILYGHNQERVFMSTNGGNTWTPLDGPALRFYSAFGVDPINTNRLYAGTAAGADLFVAKLAPSGSVLFSTYLGGSRTDYPAGIAIDARGSVYVVGTTNSPDLPLSSRHGSALAGATDAFVARMTVSVPHDRQLHEALLVAKPRLEEHRQLPQ